MLPLSLHLKRVLPGLVLPRLRVEIVPFVLFLYIFLREPQHVAPFLARREVPEVVPEI